MKNNHSPPGNPKKKKRRSQQDEQQRQSGCFSSLGLVGWFLSSATSSFESLAQDGSSSMGWTLVHLGQQDVVAPFL